MADTIKIKSGALGDRTVMPKLVENELGYQTNEKALYIGTSSGNVRLCGADDISDLNKRIDDIIARLEALEPDEEPSE